MVTVIDPVTPIKALDYLEETMLQGFMKQCEELFNQAVEKKRHIIQTMDSDYEFKYGQVVKKTSEYYLDRSCTASGYGIIVGHSDFENATDANYYRVYFSKSNNYIGCKGDTLVAVTNLDLVPQELLNNHVEVVAQVNGRRFCARSEYGSIIASP